MPRQAAPPEPKTYRVRIEPYFSVKVLDDPAHAHETFLGATAREALNRAKAALVRAHSADKLLVVNGRLIHAVSWSDPTFPDESDLLDQIMRITGGTLLE